VKPLLKLFGLSSQCFYASVKQLFQDTAGDRRSLLGMIASLQGTFNMSHPDVEQRRTGLRQLRVLAAACPQLNTTKIHLCTGTRDRENMWRRHPDNDSPQAWRDMVACMREAADTARQAGVASGQSSGFIDLEKDPGHQRSHTYGHEKGQKGGKGYSHRPSPSFNCPGHSGDDPRSGERGDQVRLRL
jgi:hypothetical protein